MAGIFSEILNMSLTGSVVILFVMLVRLLMKRLPKIYSYALWAVVLFRLLCPVSLSAPVSVLEVVQPEVEKASESTSIVYYLPAAPLQTADFVAIPAEPVSGEAQEVIEAEPELIMTPMHAVSLFWITGTAALLLYSLVQYINLKIKLVGSLQIQDNLYIADQISTAFVIGVVKPRIYLPSNVPGHEHRFILAHEQHHIRRFDHIIKLLAYLALCIHWFNPLVWAAFILAGKDMEMSCDEAVIQKFGPQIRAEYSAALLRLATHKKIIAGMPLGFGEGDTKSRVLNMVRWKKPELWVSVLCVLLCAVILVACAVNPQEENGLADISRVAGPRKVGFGDFFFELPEGFTSELTEGIQEAGKPRYEYEHIIRKGENIVGGVYALEYPDFERDDINSNVWDWVSALNVPEKVPEERFLVSVTTGIDGPYFVRAAYGRSGEEETVHYFFEGDEHVYDLWFAMRVLTGEEKAAILDTAKLVSDAESILVSDLFRINQLPEGYSHIMDENQNVLFMDGSAAVGGVTLYPIPDGIYDPADTHFSWLEEMGIPDFDDPNLCYMGGMSGFGGGWIAEFASDVPAGEEITVNRRHHFYPMGSTVCDIWFDLLQIDLDTSEKICEVVSLSAVQQGEEQTAAHDRDIHTNLELVRYGDLNMALFEDYTSRETDGTCILTKDGVDVGSITCYPAPDFELKLGQNMMQWVEALGLPESRSDLPGPIGHMISSSLYGDLEAEFFYDMDPTVLNTKHHFFIDDDLVYDISYDKNLLSDGQASYFLKSVKLHAPPVVEAGEEEQAALDKCRAVMDAVQGGSYHIISRRVNTGTEANKGYERNVRYHSGDWLSITNALTAEETVNTDVQKSSLYAGEKCFAYTGDQWVETAGTGETVEPWLASFAWNKTYVAYQGTLTDDNGECVMFRVDKKFEDFEDFDPHYFVNFYFDTNGRFRNVYLQGNLYQPNAFTLTESIVSLDEAAIQAEIRQEYEKTIG